MKLIYKQPEARFIQLETEGLTANSNENLEPGESYGSSQSTSSSPSPRAQSSIWTN